MIKNIFSFGIICLSLIIASCNDSNNPSKTQKVDLKSLVTSQSGQLDDNQTEIVALMYHNAGNFSASPEGSVELSDLTTYFTNGFSFVNPGSVKVNNAPLSLIENHTGQYSGTVDLSSCASGDFNWSIENYLGSNANFSQNFALPIVLNNFEWGDTISKSTGITISYTGAHNTDVSFLNIQNDYVSNKYFRNDTTEYETNGVMKNQADNGSLVINSGDLSDLMPGRYYSISLSHEKYFVEPYQTSFIGKFSRYYVSTVFFLSE